MSEESQPHDSAYVYSSRKMKHWYKVFPSLREKDRSRGQWVLLALLVIFAVFGGSFMGFIINTTAPPPIGNPPVQVIGVCPSPAVIVGDSEYGCVVTYTTTNAQGQAVKSVNNLAGQIIQNSTCIGNQCVAFGR